MTQQRQYELVNASEVNTIWNYINPNTEKLSDPSKLVLGLFTVPYTCFGGRKITVDINNIVHGDDKNCGEDFSGIVVNGSTGLSRE